MRLPTRLDRYPAKMVSRLAEVLVDRYASKATGLLDPFCGSGAILLAAHQRGIPVAGADLNPLAQLFASVKLEGFDPKMTNALAKECFGLAQKSRSGMPVAWDSKDYWFTHGTLHKFEQLRWACHQSKAMTSREGMAFMLAYVLAVRLCSKADQRSPKPFISKEAKGIRAHRHFDPYKTIQTLLTELSTLYGRPASKPRHRFITADMSRRADFSHRLGRYSHMITSPPYINAQDYYRNFKLELYLLEGVLPFHVDDLRERFIGTERGKLIDGFAEQELKRNRDLLPVLIKLERHQPRLADVVHRYLGDMNIAMANFKHLLQPKGTLVLVCGDNLIGGTHIRTWQVLQRLAERSGFILFDRFTDTIGDRLLPPKRSGHKGLIKEEVVSAFHLI